MSSIKSLDTSNFDALSLFVVSPLGSYKDPRTADSFNGKFKKVFELQ